VVVKVWMVIPLFQTRLRAFKGLVIEGCSPVILLFSSRLVVRSLP